MTNSNPLVHIIIVNYNGKSHLQYSLDSISETDYDNLEVVVVDNNSSDGSVDYIKSYHSSVIVIELDENRGVPAGNNIGVNYAIEQGAEYILIANNDIRVHPRWVSGAVDIAESDEDIGVVGFDVHGSVRKVSLEEYQKSVDKWSGLDYEYEDGYVDSMAALVNIDVFEDIGLFDEVYFIYGDETDFEIRAKKAGYKLARTNIPVWHHSMGTMEDTPLKSAYLAIRNRLRISIKHDPPSGILRSVGYLYYIGCNPFLDYDDEQVVVKRRRPRGIWFNFILITFAMIWNILNLPQTLKSKRQNYHQINS